MPINTEGAEQSAVFGRVIAHRPSTEADLTAVFLRRERRKTALLNQLEVKITDTPRKMRCCRAVESARDNRGAGSLSFPPNGLLSACRDRRERRCCLIAGCF